MLPDAQNAWGERPPTVVAGDVSELLQREEDAPDRWAGETRFGGKIGERRVGVLLVEGREHSKSTLDALDVIAIVLAHGMAFHLRVCPIGAFEG